MINNSQKYSIALKWENIRDKKMEFFEFSEQLKNYLGKYKAESMGISDGFWENQEIFFKKNCHTGEHSHMAVV